jgi:hypothetical protein
VLLADFEKARPRILGGLLDTVSTALRNLPMVKLDRMPRMADFAKWVSAAEEAFGCAAGAFLDAYVGNREQLNEQAIDDAPIGRPVLALMEERDVWSGSATELLAELTGLAGETAQRVTGWPKQANVLSTTLKRIAPNLRRLGVDVEFGRKGNRGRARIIMITTAAQNTVRDRPTVRVGGEGRFSPEVATSGERPDSGADRLPPAAECGPSGSHQTDLDRVDGVDDEFDNPAGGIRHKRPGCTGQSVWEHVHGGLYCGVCWPPTDKAAIRRNFSDS